MLAAPLGFLVKTWPKLSETFILEEVLGLERRGQALHLYALAPPSDDIHHPAVQRVRAPLHCVPPLAWRHVPVFLGRHLGLLARSPLAWVGGLAAALAAAPGRWGAAAQDFVRAGWLAAQLQRDGVPHLHAHFISQPADVAALAARLAGLPFSLSAHAKDIYLSEPRHLRRKLLAARFTVSCTEANCKVLRGIAPTARITRMYHGIDAALFHPHQRQVPAEGAPPLLLAVGRLREKKGLDTLVDACALLRDRGRTLRCHIVGYGEQQAALQARIQAAGLGGQVQLLGKLAREQVISCYAQASVFVQPSRITADGDRDGIPNVLLEAMAMGLPVVASAISGIPELVSDRRNGLLVVPDDPAALANAITSLLDNPALARQLGHAARVAVTQRFDNDLNLQQLEQLLAMPHDCTAPGHATGHAGSHHA